MTETWERVAEVTYWKQMPGWARQPVLELRALVQMGATAESLAGAASLLDLPRIKEQAASGNQQPASAALELLIKLANEADASERAAAEALLALGRCRTFSARNRRRVAAVAMGSKEWGDVSRSPIDQLLTRFITPLKQRADPPILAQADDDLRLVSSETLYFMRERSAEFVVVTRQVQARDKPIAGTSHLHQYYGARGEGFLTFEPRTGCRTTDKWLPYADGYAVSVQFGHELQPEEPYRYSYIVRINGDVEMQPVLRCSYVEPNSTMTIGIQFETECLPWRVMMFENKKVSTEVDLDKLTSVSIDALGYVEHTFGATRLEAASGFRFEFPV